MTCKAAKRAWCCTGLKGRGWHPFLGIGYGLRTDTTLAQLTSEGIDFRVRAPLHRHLKFDVRPHAPACCLARNVLMPSSGQGVVATFNSYSGQSGVGTAYGHRRPDHARLVHVYAPAPTQHPGQGKDTF